MTRPNKPSIPRVLHDDWIWNRPYVEIADRCDEIAEALEREVAPEDGDYWIGVHEDAWLFVRQLADVVDDVAILNLAGAEPNVRREVPPRAPNGRIIWLLQRTAEHLRKGLGVTPSDPNAYRSASELWRERFDSYKKFKSWLDEQPAELIRRWKPTTQRLKIHIGDWLKYWENEKSEISDEAIDEFLKGVDDRKNEVRSQPPVE